MLKAQGTSCAILLPEDERELRCRSRRLRRVTLVASNLIRMAFKIRDHVVDGHLIMHSNKPRKRDGFFLAITWQSASDDGALLFC